MLCGKCLLVIPVFLAFFAYRYIQFMPPGAMEPRNQMITLAFVRVSDDILYFLSLFGYSEIEMRKRMFENLPKPDPDPRVETVDQYFDGVKVRIYRPKSLNEKVLPALVYFHGGGWKYLSIDNMEPLTRNLSLHADIVVVSVEYRLMPEFRFPAQFDDCLKVTEYLMKNAKHYNVDPSRIGVAGDSAGGNLAAAIALKFAKETKPGFPNLKLQVLLYPVLQAFDFSFPSLREFSDRNCFCYFTTDVLVDTVRMYGFQDHGTLEEISNNMHVLEETRKVFSKIIDQNLLPPGFRERGGQRPSPQTPNKDLAALLYQNVTNPYMWPLMASDEDLRKLPKTYIAVTEYDPLRDEDLIFAERLKRTIGKQVELKYWAGLEHGLYQFYNYKYSSVAIDILAEYLKQNL